MRLALELLGGRYTDPSIVSFPEKLADGCSTTKDCSCCSQRSRSDARCFLADGPGSECPAGPLVLPGQLPACPRPRPDFHADCHHSSVLPWPELPTSASVALN